MRRCRALWGRGFLRDVAEELLGINTSEQNQQSTGVKKIPPPPPKVSREAILKVDEVDKRLVALGVFRRGHTLRDSDDVIKEIATALRRQGYALSELSPEVWGTVVQRAYDTHVGSALPLIEVLHSKDIFLPKNTYLTIMRNFAKLKQVNKVLNVIELLLAAGHPACSKTLEVLVKAYNAKNNFRAGLEVFLEYWRAGVQPCADAFSELIRGSGCLQRGLAIASCMLQCGVPPNEHTYVALMRCCAVRHLQVSADVIMKHSKVSGHDHSQGMWLQYMSAYKMVPDALPAILQRMQHKGVPLATPHVFLYIAYMAQYATVAGNAAVLHAERLFQQALALPLHRPEQMYSEMLAVYIKSQDHKNVVKLVNFVKRTCTRPPGQFSKRLRKYNKIHDKSVSL
eukprot:TRINITY_DN8732_c0_g1_i2.p1 TRINITY_DN8732_c0_g1~~TRINITY_DN8732_c0_g1_i2.p1  ORF type:complete len:398 (+),score=106.19 TRINITY_DN8732_c0_g1_i2:357-1550(+)